MKELEKTTIVPDEDPKNILKEPILKMIVLGNNKPLAVMANELAFYPPIKDRRVIWYKHFTEDEIRRLFDDLTGDFNTILAFSLSTKNLVADYIRQGDIVDEVRMEEVYTNAGLPEFN